MCGESLHVGNNNVSFFLLSPSPPLFSLRAMGGREGAKGGPGFDKCSPIILWKYIYVLRKPVPRVRVTGITTLAGKRIVC